MKDRGVEKLETVEAKRMASLVTVPEIWRS
jgi:hypothetical protein